MSLPRFVLAALASAACAVAADVPLKMDPRATPVAPGGPAPAFAPDPVNTTPYDFQSQLDIYGAKHLNPTARPLLELGREMYGPGQFKPGINLLGEKNLVTPQLLFYGDLRTAVAWNNNGATEKGVAAAKLDLDLDLKITATERIHYFFTPLDRNGDVTRTEFAGDRPRVNRAVLDFTPDALFFEGDLARLAAGFTGRDNRHDIPFTFGLIPLLFQNGVWLQDAFDGVAFTIPARNSPSLQITNMDVTFFAGFDQVTTPALRGDSQGHVFGFNTFIEANHGYWEFGYGYVEGTGASSDLSYHNISAAFTKRYFDRVANSVRVIGNFGQEPAPGKSRTADGVLLLVENSLVSSSPSVLVPYLNGWVGFHRPQSLARAAGAGGVLLNTGIVFETDGLTGFPKLDDTGHNTYGAALGLEYLFDLHQQIVVEAAALNTFGNPAERTAPGAEYGVGIRYQLPLNNTWIFRADGIAAARDHAADLLGFRVELRRKF
jgi:hypothetical protein